MFTQGTLFPGDFKNPKSQGLISKTDLGKEVTIGISKSTKREWSFSQTPRNTNLIIFVTVEQAKRPLMGMHWTRCSILFHLVKPILWLFKNQSSLYE